MPSDVWGAFSWPRLGAKALAERVMVLLLCVAPVLAVLLFLCIARPGFQGELAAALVAPLVLGNAAAAFLQCARTAANGSTMFADLPGMFDRQRIVAAFLQILCWLSVSMAPAGAVILLAGRHSPLGLALSILLTLFCWPFFLLGALAIVTHGTISVITIPGILRLGTRSSLPLATVVCLELVLALGGGASIWIVLHAIETAREASAANAVLDWGGVMWTAVSRSAVSLACLMYFSVVGGRLLGLLQRNCRHSLLGLVRIPFRRLAETDPEICVRCGAAILPTAQDCDACGGNPRTARLPTVPARSEAPLSEEDYGKRVVIGALLAVFLAAPLFLLGLAWQERQTRAAVARFNQWAAKSGYAERQARVASAQQHDALTLLDENTALVASWRPDDSYAAEVKKREVASLGTWKSQIEGGIKADKQVRANAEYYAQCLPEVASVVDALCREDLDGLKAPLGSLTEILRRSTDSCGATPVIPYASLNQELTHRWTARLEAAIRQGASHSECGCTARVDIDTAVFLTRVQSALEDGTLAGHRQVVKDWRGVLDTRHTVLGPLSGAIAAAGKGKPDRVASYLGCSVLDAGVEATCRILGSPSSRRSRGSVTVTTTTAGSPPSAGTPGPSYSVSEYEWCGGALKGVALTPSLVSQLTTHEYVNCVVLKQTGGALNGIQLGMTLAEVLGRLGGPTFHPGIEIPERQLHMAEDKEMWAQLFTFPYSEQHADLNFLDMQQFMRNKKDAIDRFRQDPLAHTDDAVLEYPGDFVVTLRFDKGRADFTVCGASVWAGSRWVPSLLPE